jgi:hypothetical protein
MVVRTDVSHVISGTNMKGNHIERNVFTAPSKRPSQDSIRISGKPLVLFRLTHFYLLNLEILHHNAQTNHQ